MIVSWTFLGETMYRRIEEIITKEINPVLAQHNGSIELTLVDDNVAFVKFSGSCGMCPGKKQTITNLIRPCLLYNVKDLKDVKII